LPVVTEKINFSWGRKSPTRVVKIIGFTWRKCNSKWRILIEKPEFVSWRHKYLVQMKRFREEGKDIFYADESWIGSNITFSKCWQGETEFGIEKNCNARNRPIILHAGSENGFLAAIGDYHGQMNGAKANSTNAFILNSRSISFSLCLHRPHHVTIFLPGA
jgi:hypothetical protein